MKLLKTGKTKDVYELEDGNILLRFKDDATINEDGKLDPGGNTVGASIEGLGRASLKMTKYYFEKINASGEFTHYISCDPEGATMTVRRAENFGRGVEMICRLKAVGSFLRRYGDYCDEGQDLGLLVEVSLKDDERGDPMITADTLEMLGIMSVSEYECLKSLTKRVTTIIRDDLAEKGLELYDIKVEFGKISGEVALIDEISSGCMRVYKDGVWVQSLELDRYFE